MKGLKNIFSKQAAREMMQFSEDARGFDNNRAQLAAQYPAEEWLAVFRNKVVAHAKALDDVMQQLDAKKIKRGAVYLDKLERDNQTWFFPVRSGVAPPGGAVGYGVLRNG